MRFIQSDDFKENPICLDYYGPYYEPGWDGHHRVCVAKRFNIPAIWATVRDCQGHKSTHVQNE
ncbi:MAG: hypothetical protein H0Z39_11720 [Peptococcaceae bacterium]|nr:hypothetical protein [Peptococcaceae bacterium]